MHGMFWNLAENATSPFSLDLSSWDVSNVTTMAYMFFDTGMTTKSFSLGDLSGWNTSNVIDMYAMFYKSGYSATYSIDCTKWNVSKVTNHDSFNGWVTTKVKAPIWK